MKTERASKKERILSFVLALALLIGVMPGGIFSLDAFAVDDALAKVQLIFKDTYVVLDEATVKIKLDEQSDPTDLTRDEDGLYVSDVTVSDSVNATITVYKDNSDIMGNTATVTLSPEKPIALFDIDSNAASAASEPVKAAALVAAPTLSQTVFEFENGNSSEGKSFDEIKAEALPASVELTVTGNKTVEAVVNWDENAKTGSNESYEYEKESYKKQEFYFIGTVELSDDILNIYNYSLDLRVDVTVLAETSGTITQNPADSDLMAGQKLNLSVVVDNEDKVDACQWYKDGQAIENATALNYKVDRALTDHAGSYYCAVTYRNGSVENSESADVTVTRTDVTLKVTLGYDPNETDQDVTIQVTGVPKDAKGTLTYEVKKVSDTEFVTLSGNTFHPNTSNPCVVRVSFSGDDLYNASSAETQIDLSKQCYGAVRLVIDSQEQELNDLKLDTDYAVALQDGEGNTLPGTGDVSYTIVNVTDPDGKEVAQGDYADYVSIEYNSTDTTAKVKLLLPCTVELKAKKNGDANYNTSDESEDLTVAAQRLTRVVSFVDPEPEAITYDPNNNTFTNQVADITDATITYSIVGEGTGATVDNNGTVEYTQSGTFTVKASVAANATYSAAEAVYELTVNKAKQTLTFDKSYPEGKNEFSYGYGIETFENQVNAASVLGTGEITYEITAGEDIASIENGKLTFQNGKIGSVTVKATITADKCYDEAECSYTITISEKEFGLVDGFSIVGEQKDANSGWYTNDITISYPNCSVSYTNNLGDDGWSDSVTINSEGSDNETTLYLRSFNTETQCFEISKALKIPSDRLKLDKASPQNVSVEFVNENWVSTVFGALSFGIIGSHDNVRFELSASDGLSGIHHFEWKYLKVTNPDGSLTETILRSGNVEADENGKFIGTLDISVADVRNVWGKLDITAYDAAGNAMRSVTDEALTLDTQKPDSEDLTVSFSDAVNVSGNTRYYDKVNTPVEVSLTVAESCSGVKLVEWAYKDASGQTIESGSVDSFNSAFAEDQQKWTWTPSSPISIDSENSVSGSLSFYITDGAGNRSEEITSDTVIVIDRTAPVVTASFDGCYAKYCDAAGTTLYQEGQVSEDIKLIAYHEKDKTFVLSITDPNFNPETDVPVVKKAFSAAKAADVDFDQADFTEINGVSWQKDESVDDTWNAVIKLDEAADGFYTYKVSCRDFSGNEAEFTTPEIVVDTALPTVRIDLPTGSENEFYFNDSVAATVTVWVKLKRAFNASKLSLTDFKAVSVKNVSLDENNAIQNGISSQLTDGEWSFEEAGGGYAYTKTVTFNDAAHYSFAVKASTFAQEGSSSGFNVSDDKSVDKFVVDLENPSISGEFTETQYKYADTNGTNRTDNILDAALIAYDNTDGEFTIVVTEENFNPKSVTVTQKSCTDGAFSQAGGDVNNLEWSEPQDPNGKVIHTATIKLDAEGFHQFTVTCKDLSGREAETYESPVILVDTSAPEISVELSSAQVYNQDTVTATVKVWVAFTGAFLPEKVKLESFSAVDADGKDVSSYKNLKLAYENALKDSWNGPTEVQNNEQSAYGYLFTKTISLEVDAQYSFGVSAETFTKKTGTATVEKVVVDKTDPTVEIEYVSDTLITTVLSSLSFGYYKPYVTVKAQAVDITSGIDYITLLYNRPDDAGINNVEKEEYTSKNSYENADFVKSGSTATYTIIIEGKQYDGFFTAEAFDMSGRSTKDDDTSEKRIIVDTIDPDRSVTIEYDRAVDRSFNDVAESAVVEGADILLMSRTSATITFRVTETNFKPEDIKHANQNSDTVATDKDGNLKDLGCEIIVYKNGASFKTMSDDVLTWTNDPARSDIWHASFAIDNSNWGDGEYQVEFKYKDRADNEMKTYTSQPIIIDSTKPTVSIEFVPEDATANGIYFNGPRKAIITVQDAAFRADAVGVNFAGNEQINTQNTCAEFTYTAVDVEGNDVKKDATVDDKADSWNWSPNVKEWKYANDNTWTAEVTFEKDAHYTFTFNCKDILGNNSETWINPEFVVDKTAPDKYEIGYSRALFETVIDTITFHGFARYYNPSVTVTFTGEDDTSGIQNFYWQYNRSKDASSSILEADSGVVPVSTVARRVSASITLTSHDITDQYRGHITVAAEDRALNRGADYYDGNNEFVIDTINPERMVTLSEAKQAVRASDQATVNPYNYQKDNGSGEIVYYDAASRASIRITEANFYPQDVKVTVNDVPYNNIGWNRTGTEDEWEGYVDFTTDGHYILRVQYTDRSTNEMREYVSDEIIVDTVNPVISVAYAPAKEIRRVGDLIYYDARQTATVTITEHNFRAGDVVVDVKARDVAGADVAISDFVAQLQNPANWSTSGDVHTATISYSADAIYSFDISYKDLSLREAADYKPDNFVVDTEAPKNITVSYSAPVLDAVISGVSFGFYKSNATVTIEADDDVAGVTEFVYSYIKSVGVSSVNAELIEATISESAISYSAGGRHATADFTIPREALTPVNQFRGTVQVRAMDRSNNVSGDLKEEKVKVVDNIAPTASVSFNTPVSQHGGVNYYAGNIVATIVITEANFFPEDVNITINGRPTSANGWTQSGDKWTATVVLSQDGEYKIGIHYIDKSTNQMVDYQSEQLIIDRTPPKITVNGIKNESANKADVIGFTITAEDTNFTQNAFKPELTAVLRDENGKFVVKLIENGQYSNITSTGGVYTVSNLTADAIYTLKCSVVDLSGNKTTTMKVSDSANLQTDVVVFSVNRNGSTFMLGEKTQALVDKYYTQKVDGNIEIFEVNVDPLKEYSVSLNGESLVENENFTVTKSGGGTTSWNAYTYSVPMALFDKESEYNVKVRSVDSTDKAAFSDIENASVAFVVDRTAPLVAVSGIEKGGRYRALEQTVTLIPTDSGGMLDSLTVTANRSKDEPIMALDKDGNKIASLDRISGDELLDILDANDGKITFQLEQSTDRQDVVISCTDKAGNKYESADKFNDITITTNIVILLWRNPVVKFGVIGGGAALAAGLIILVFLKKKKKTKPTNDEA